MRDSRGTGAPRSLSLRFDISQSRTTARASKVLVLQPWGKPMSMTGLNARALKSTEIARAFALVQFVSPQTSFASWRRLAEKLLAPVDRGQSGILTVQDSRGVLLGILHYRKCPRLPHRATMLGLDPLICGASARHQIAIMQALLRALEHLAAQAGCDSLASQLPGHLDGATRQALRESLRNAGYGYEERSFVKPLVPSAMAPAQVNSDAKCR